MKTRLMGWGDWGISNPKAVMKDIREKAAGDIEIQLLILDACTKTYPGISSYLYESIVHRKSYDSMCVAIKKDDFYAYRRKAVAIYLGKVGTKK